MVLLFFCCCFFVVVFFCFYFYYYLFYYFLFLFYFIIIIFLLLLAEYSAKYKWRYTGNATITKYCRLEAPKEGEMRNNIMTKRPQPMEQHTDTGSLTSLYKQWFVTVRCYMFCGVWYMSILFATRYTTDQLVLPSPSFWIRACPLLKSIADSRLTPQDVSHSN